MKAIILAFLPIGLFGQTFVPVPIAAPGTNPSWTVTLAPQDILTRTWKRKPKTETISAEICTMSQQGWNIPISVIRGAAALAGRTILTSVAQSQALSDASKNNGFQLGLDAISDIGQGGTALMAIGTIKAGTAVGGILVAAQAIGPLIKNRLTPRLPDLISLQSHLIGSTLPVPGATGGAIEGCVPDMLLVGIYTGTWAPVRLECLGTKCVVEK